MQVGTYSPENLDLIQTPTTKMAVALVWNREERGLHIYEGTVPAKVKAKRRAAGKAARIARRASR